MIIKEPNKKWARWLGLIAFIGFGVSLLAHVVTFFGIDPSQTIPCIWGLHVGMFVVFIPLVLSANTRFKREGGSRSSSFKESWALWGKIFAPVPLWVRVVGVGLFIYAMVNFIIFMGLSEGGGPGVQDGKYVLESHGTVIRELTEEEYKWHKAYVVRGFSGHWLIFYFIPAIYFTYLTDNQNTSSSDSIFYITR